MAGTCRPSDELLINTVEMTEYSGISLATRYGSIAGLFNETITNAWNTSDIVYWDGDRGTQTMTIKFNLPCKIWTYGTTSWSTSRATLTVVNTDAKTLIDVTPNTSGYVGWEYMCTIPEAGTYSFSLSGSGNYRIDSEWYFETYEVPSVEQTFTYVSDTELLYYTQKLKEKIDANNYTLPTASTTALGGVKVDGSTVTIDENGVISSTNKIDISSADGNALTEKDDGLYVPESSGGNSTTKVDEMYLNIDRYSTEEQVIGKWTNGKPIYRVVVNWNGNSIGSSGTGSNISTYISDVDEMINYEALGDDSKNYYWSVQTCTDNRAIWFNKDFTYIYCANTNRTYTFNYLIFEYTKTTDSANSFTNDLVTGEIQVTGIGYENYSTDEIVIGKWINGKPVYRRLFKEVDNYVPILTSTTENVIFSSSYNTTTYPPYYVFDEVEATTTWVSSTIPCYIGYNFEEFVTVNTYSITNRKINSDDIKVSPTSLILQGSNDDSEWVDLDTQTLIWSSAGETKTFNINESTYKMFRVYLNGSNSYNQLCIANLIFGYNADALDTNIVLINSYTSNNYKVIEYTKTTDEENSFTASMVASGISEISGETIYTDAEVASAISEILGGTS